MVCDVASESYMFISGVVKKTQLLKTINILHNYSGKEKTSDSNFTNNSRRIKL